MRDERVKPLVLPTRVQRAEETSNGAVSASESTAIHGRTILSTPFEERREERRKKKLSPGYLRVQEKRAAAVRYWTSTSKIGDQRGKNGWMLNVPGIAVDTDGWKRREGSRRRENEERPVCGLSDNANRLSHITVLFPLFQRLARRDC